MLFIILMFGTLIVSGQSTETDLPFINANQNTVLPATYVLYPTRNRWTFLKLNTRNGKIWQVQYSLDDENRFETYLNVIPLVEPNEEKDNRFALYPTQNIWTFILLDQINGLAYQVQWSTESKNRGIWFIK